MPTPRGIADPATAIKRYQEGTAAAGERWKEGVLNPRRSAKQAALKAAKRWATGVTEAVTQDNYTKGINRIDENAIDATINLLGGSVYTAGVAARLPKASQRIGDSLAKTKAVVDGLADLPGDTREQRAERAKQFALRRGKAG